MSDVYSSNAEETLCHCLFSSPSPVSCVTAKAHLGMWVRENKRNEEQGGGWRFWIRGMAVEPSGDRRAGRPCWLSSALFSSCCCLHSPGWSWAVPLPNLSWCEVCHGCCDRFPNTHQNLKHLSPGLSSSKSVPGKVTHHVFLSHENFFWKLLLVCSHRLSVSFTVEANSLFK